MDAIWKEKETEHYLFHYKANSLAEQEIQQIIELQEGCFKEVTVKLEFIPEVKIIYWLCDTREEVKRISGYEYETNGVTFLELENPTIYAVYNEDVKCVGGSRRCPCHFLSMDIFLFGCNDRRLGHVF